MNQTVENIFADMFAPKAIPIEVINLFDKVNYFVQKSGLPGLRRIDMCIIAGLALDRGVKLQERETRDLDGSEIVDTSDTEEPDSPVENVEMYVDDATEQDEIEAFDPTAELPPPPEEGAKMDAPKAPDPQNKRKANIEVLLERMTTPELLSHAKDICGITPQKIMGKQGFLKKEEIKKIPKQKIIKAIMEASK